MGAGDSLLSLAQVLAFSAIAVLAWVAEFFSALFTPCLCRKRPLKPTSVLITGATSGIGEALAVHYAKPGVHIAICGRNAAALEAVEKQCKAKGATVSAKRCDVTEKEVLSEWILAVDKEHPLDLVVANAGITEATARVDKADQIADAAYKLFDVNVTGVFNTIFPALPAMKERKRGQIALVSSLAGFGALASNQAYCATKCAVKAYGEGLRAMLYRDNVHVNVICPGYVKSPMTDANQFKQPFMVSMNYAVKTISRGLAADLPVIAFPGILVTVAWLMAALPWTIRDWIARNRIAGQIAYWKKSRKASAAPAGAAAASSEGASKGRKRHDL